MFPQFTKIDQNPRKRKHTLYVCHPLRSDSDSKWLMADSCSTSTSGKSHQDEVSYNFFVSAQHNDDRHNGTESLSSIYLDSESVMKQENIVGMDIYSSCSDNSCTSIKQCRKMQTGLESVAKVNYEWKQTNSDISITVHLSEEQASSLQHVNFTSREVDIQLSADKSLVIEFCKDIEKDKSRVQLKKQGPVTLLLVHVVKQYIGNWDQLEASCEKSGDNHDKFALPVLCHETVNKNICNSKANMGNIKRLEEEHEIGDTGEVADVCEEQDVDSDPEIMEKAEEPVYNLDHLKNDFFERGLLLTLQVYAKQVEKDSVKIHFSKQGFVLKFRTEDAKFLQLHEGTTKETTFTWPVTTRKEILPEECKFKVKASVIEILLQKKSQERWISLEAPSRKENVENSKSDTWMPIRKSSQTSSASAETSLASSAEATTHVSEQASSRTASNVMFDDLSDVDINVEGCSSKVISVPGYSHQSDEAEGASGSLFGDSLKVRPSASQDWNKPTAKVHPLNSQTSEKGTAVPPGFAGLVNFGNTCFMNCVLQVLANTREFRDYFLDGRFQQDINEDNPLGMRGQLAATFGVLLRWLWSCKEACWEPRRLKDLISKKNAQFFGYAQHDAHEFLAFLLDGLHEDLNRIRKKPYTETIDSDGRSDEVVAAEAWAQYKQRNDSVVVDLFQGQYKSKLVCPKCGKVSITFDPFLYLSVPLPKKKTTITVTFMWKESYKRPVRYHIQVPQDSTVEKLMEELSTRTNVRTSDMRVFEAFKGRIKKFFYAGARLDNVEQKDIIIACEVLSEELAGEKVLEIIVMQRTMHPIDYPARCAFCHKLCSEGILLKRCTKCYKVGYCDHTCQRNHWSLHKAQCSSAPDPVGCPFILSLPCSRATYGNLVKHMEAFSRFSVDVFQPPVKSSEAIVKNSVSFTATSLNNSLSQSSSSLNSLDSLSSASSTCTLTGNQSDPLEVGEESGEAVLAADQCDLETNVPASAPSSTPQAASSSDCQSLGETVSSSWFGGSDSGFESIASKPSERAVPMSQVMGIQAAETEREKATPTFYIKPVTLEGVGIIGADRLEDRGEQPLELMNRRILSMDWRNNEKQPFYVLVQSKDLEAEEATNLNNIAATCSNRPTLHQCLELFTEPEILSPEEAWYCPSCKKHVEASKQMTIWRLPHILVIQLKRFSFQNFLMRAKVKKHVDFPTRGLDMSRYCVGLRPDEPPPIYDLYAVVNHHGHLIGGHYTSYVRCCSDSTTGSDEIGWRLCDDSRVSPVANEKSVVTSDAYLLFYHRRGHQAVIGSSCQKEDTEVNKNNSVTDPHLIYSSLMDERNGNVQPSQMNSVKNVESVNKKLSRDQNSGDGLDIKNIYQQSISRVDNAQMNLQNTYGADSDINQPNISKGKVSSCSDKGPSSQYKNEETGTVEMLEAEADDDEFVEKGDKEKDICDYGTQKDIEFSDDDDDREDRNLVIDMNSDLSYTDMEAVD